MPSTIRPGFRRAEPRVDLRYSIESKKNDASFGIAGAHLRLRPARHRSGRWQLRCLPKSAGEQNYEIGRPRRSGTGVAGVAARPLPARITVDGPFALD
jgi:hypothetical protein